MNDKVRKYDVTIAISLLSLLFIAPCLYAGWLWHSDISSCDTSIQYKLKAPSTYRRISSKYQGSGEYQIAYDAENSFGVPLRGRGICTIDRATGMATFDEMSDGGAL